MENKEEQDITIESSKLYKHILSEQNIYNAIYALESYVFEKGLLEDEDLELYFKLADKYDVDFIRTVIFKCKKRLEEILTSPETLFDVKVFFKVKKVDDDGRIKYRPLHTASLLDQICMVCLLTPLMFEDTKKGRKLSDLSKLIPHNFFGNIPSTNVQTLFEKWQWKYKEYTDVVIEHCREYQKSHRYRTEVTLDIKNFFPSISPKFIFNFIVEKLASTYTNSKEVKALRMVVAKLLYFNIEKNNIEDWCKDYYGEDVDLNDTKVFMVCGIPQGLPQSYLFGNLCMIEIKKILGQDSIFSGDAYFYVDDSVIYVKTELEDETFKNEIKKLNESLSTWNTDERKISNQLLEIIDQKYIDFQSRLRYKIQFHEEGKSDYRKIDEADNHLGGYENIARQTSMAGALFSNLDEIDDNVTLKKLTALDEVIAAEIERLEEKREKELTSNHENILIVNDKYASRLKLMRRFKRYFLYRRRLLEIREDGELTPKYYNEFLKRFSINSKSNEIDRKKWFEHFDEDIFQSECRLFIDMQCRQKATLFRNEIAEFEKQLTERKNKDSDYLYFRKDLAGALKIKSINIDQYGSLKCWINENYKGTFNIGQSSQIEKLRSFMKEQYQKMIRNGFNHAKFTKFVFINSSEYKRRILNAYFSEMIGVTPSDALSFTKNNSRILHYTELRILAQLRNKSFDCKLFKVFIDILDPHDLSNRMGIDMGLLEVLGHFVSKVRNPEWVDSLIITHRVVKGLWYNGSKFLNSYTLHNEEHAVTLINKALRIVKAIDYFALKKIDFYVLFLACYLHDISMVVHPDLYSFNSNNTKSLEIISKFISQLQNKTKLFERLELNDDKDNRFKEAGNFLIELFQDVFDFFEAEVRGPHPFNSAQYIRNSTETFLKHICPAILSYVAKVSESHGYDSIEVYGLKSKAKNDLISEKYLMILIRLADLLDVSNDRVNYYLLRQNIKHMNKISRFHWISHLITDDIQLTPTYEVHKNSKLNEKPIIERLNFNLYLNVKYLSTISKNEKCKECGFLYPYDKKVVEFSDEYTNSDGITLRIGEKCNEECCPFICRWVSIKHHWLIKELNALNDYLFSVNTSLMNTEIRLNIFFRDEYPLEADLFDDVRDFLENNI